MIYAFADHELDTGTYELRCGGAVTAVEPQVFDVLVHLVVHRDRVVTKEELLDEVWGDRYVSESALTSRIKAARRAVGDDGRRQAVIRTVHGRGYRFVAPVEERDGGAASPPRPAPAPLVPATTLVAGIAPPGAGGGWPPRTRYARSGRYSVAYQVVGDGPRDVVFIPGFVSNVELQWEFEPMARFFGRLAGIGRLIVFDKRGTGLSDRVPTTELPPLEERMDDVRAVMDAAGSERASLVGISEGGPLALLFAATYPERVERLVLCNTYADRFHPEIPRLAGMARDGWGTGATFRVLAPSWTDPDTRRFLARYERHSATPDAAAHLVELCDLIDVRSILSSISVPTRVVHRRGDSVVGLDKAERLAAGIPGAELVLLEGSDHLVYVDQEPVLEAVEEFLTGAPVARAPDRVLTTVLFADVVGSTEQAERLGDARWRDVLAQLYAAARRAIQAHRGQQVTTTGDGVLATFDGPARAVHCGQALQLAAAPLGLTLRVGVHTAEVERLGDDIAGVGVHIGARVAAAAAPGEVWVTRTVRDLVAGSGLRFEARGVHRFKGISEAWDLYGAVQ